MSKNSTLVAILSIGSLVVALAWGISPVFIIPTSAEITPVRSETPALLTSTLKIVNQKGRILTTISLWNGDSPFLAVEEGQRLPQRSCMTYKNNVTELDLREIRDKREWLTNLHSMTNPGMVHEQSQITCEFTFSPRIKGEALSVFIKRTDTPAPFSTPFQKSSGPVTFHFSGNKEIDEHVFAMY